MTAVAPTAEPALCSVPSERSLSRRELSQEADARLRERVIVVCTTLLVLNALVCIAAILLDLGLDRDMLPVFGVVLCLGAVVGWLVRVKRAVCTAATVCAVYFALVFLFLALQIGSLPMLATAWPMVPPLFGLYVGGRRLGMWMTLAMLVSIACSVAVHVTGVGLTMMKLPPLDQPAGILSAGAGMPVSVFLVHLYETTRARMRRELDAALVEIEQQAQTLSTLVESASDAILLLDDRQQVVASNDAAKQLAQRIVGFDVRRGQSFTSIVLPERRTLWQSRLEACARTGILRIEDVVATHDGEAHFETSIHRVGSPGGMLGFTLFVRDITERREAEASMQRLRSQLLEASRSAGRAEVAATVLHNVGNVLNSVNVSADQIGDIARDVRVSSFRKSVEMLAASEVVERELGDRGSKLLLLLRGLVDALERQRDRLMDESGSLGDRLAHIAAILQLQQKHTRTVEVHEELDLDGLLRAALTLDEGWRGTGIELTWEVAEAARHVVSDRHKLLQILINLLRNARDAVRETGGPGEVHVGVDAGEQPGTITITVADTGVGIEEAHREDVFRAGFTTKLDGHGFGLHSAALLAADLGGALTLRAAGTGRGATFVLELPREARTGASDGASLAA